MLAKLNGYVWEVYKASFEGQLALGYFENLEKFAERADLFQPFLGVGDFIAAHSDEQLDWEDVALDPEDVDYILRIKGAAEKLSAGTPQEVQELLAFLTESGTVRMSDQDDDFLNIQDPFNYLPLLSFGLYLAHPNTFLPYGFVGRYFFIPKIAETFGITLPPVPPKTDYLARWLFSASYAAHFMSLGKPIR